MKKRMMTAAEIRDQIALILVGDLRGVPAALATTGARTEAAREDLRAALAHREARCQSAGPSDRARARAARGEASTPTTRSGWRLQRGVAIVPFGIRLVEYRAAKLAARRAAIAESLAPAVLAAYKTCGYRRAHGTWWAGGEHTTAVRVEERATASATKTQAWSANHKWSGLDSRHVIVVSESWGEIPVEARVVEDCLTLGASPTVLVNVWRATWAKQGRGTDLNVVHGYLVRGEGGDWTHALTEAQAIRRAKADRAAYVCADKHHPDCLVCEEIARDCARHARSAAQSEVQS